MIMKRLTVVVLFGLCGMSLSCARTGDDTKNNPPSPPKLTREYLLAHGFKQSPEDPDLFTREHALWRDVSRDLALPLASLAPVTNGRSTMRTADFPGVHIFIETEFLLIQRNGVRYRVDYRYEDPDATCMVRVRINVSVLPPRQYLKTDSTPRLVIKSVAVPEDRSKPLQVELEVTAIGKKPVAISRYDFNVHLVGGSIPASQPLVGHFLPKATPEVIVVTPDKPFLLPISVVTGRWSAGDYTLRIWIGDFKTREPQEFDYEWEGKEYWSKEYKFVVK